jgi:lysophospholipase L1-like esterase
VKLKVARGVRHVSTKRVVQNIGLVVATCVVLLLTLEGIARKFLVVPQVGPVFTTYVADLGLWNKSNLRCVRVAPEYRTRVSTNSIGLRGPEVAPTKAQGTKRLLCLGDSFTFGKGVDDSTTYTAQLQHALDARLGHDAWEVLNAGVVSYGTANAYQFLKARGLALEPDAVVLQMCWNDFQENVECGLFSLDDGANLVAAADPYARLRKMVRLHDRIPGHALLDNSYLFNFVRVRLNLAVLWPTRRNTVQVDERAQKAAGAAQERMATVLLQHVARVCSDDQISLIVVLFDLKPTWNQLVRDALQAEQVHVLDFGDLRQRSPQLYYAVDGHWNPAGHRYVATHLATTLETAGIMTRSGHAGLR